MGLNKNPEIVKETAVYLVLTAAAAAAGFFLQPVCGIPVLVLGLVLTAVHYGFAKQRYRRIADLSRSLDRILHGQEEVLIDGSEEGELSILTTEVQKMLVRLKEQTDMLRASKTNLTRAIEDIFHQLRTPLTSMNLTVALLAEENLAYEKRIRLTRDLRRQLERISWLVEALLKMSRIDAGVVNFLRKDLAAAEVIRKASEALLIPMELKGQTFDVAVGDERLSADLSWTAEALGNLIKNCMEHTPAGGTITVAVTETALYTGFVIRDSGPGFVPEDIPFLFERFYKGKNASAGSIGIGLALSRMIISAQEGNITARNAEGGGAEFDVKFYKSVV